MKWLSSLFEGEGEKKSQKNLKGSEPPRQVCSSQKKGSARRSGGEEEEE